MDIVKKANKNEVGSRGGDRAESKVRKKDGLTAKESLFVSAYLGESRFNATQAARIAGYKGNDVTLSSVGYENLRKPQIAATVNERINEAAMSSNEVLSRLSDIASGKITDVVDDDGNFDLKLAKERGKDQLLKKLKIKRTSKKVDSFTPARGDDEEERETLETALIYEEVEFEMYSAHEALRDLGKYHRLFADRVEHSGKDGGPFTLNVVYESKP